MQAVWQSLRGPATLALAGVLAGPLSGQGRDTISLNSGVIDPRRPRAHQTAEDVEVVDHLVEKVRASPRLSAPPVARN